MTNAYYTSPSDAAAATKVRAIDINSVDAAIDAAFDKLPTETNIKQGKVNYAVDTGTTNTYVVSLPHAPASYADGLEVKFKPIHTNTGASTIDVSGLGVKSIKKYDGTDPVAGDIRVNAPLVITYNASTGYFYMPINAGEVGPSGVLGGTAVSAINELKGSDIPSASTIDLDAATGNFVHITGTTTITAITLTAGAERTLVFDGVLTLTHNATTLIIPSGQNIVTAAGDSAIVRGEGSGNVRVIDYIRAGSAVHNQQKGSDVASATTVNFDTATGDFVHITGTTTITAITLASGHQRTVVFDGSLTLTHNATTLILPGGANITTAAGDRAIFRGDGSGNTRCISYVRADGTPVISSMTLHVREERASGTAGGGSSAGYNTRTLNTVVTNTISGASLASDLITLPAGTYDIYATAPINNSAGHRLDLYNNSDSTTVLRGIAAYCTTIGINTHSVCIGRFTLSAQKDLKLRHYTGGTQATNGLGLAVSEGGVNEIYASAQIWKV